MQNGEASNHDIITGEKTRKLYGQDGASRKNITGKKRKIEVNIMTRVSQYDDNRKTVTGKNFEQTVRRLTLDIARICLICPLINEASLSRLTSWLGWTMGIWWSHMRCDVTQTVTTNPTRCVPISRGPWAGRWQARRDRCMLIVFKPGSNNK